MRLSRPLKLTATATAFIALTACSSIPFFGNSGNDDKEQLDKAGRVTMVLAEEAVEAKPELATESIELLPPTDMASWPEAGGTPAKAPGHVNAAPDLKTQRPDQARQDRARRRPCRDRWYADRRKWLWLCHTRQRRRRDRIVEARAWRAHDGCPHRQGRHDLCRLQQ